MTFLVIAYIASIACVSLFMINRSEREETARVQSNLESMERRVFCAEEELKTLRATGAMPYRGDLAAAHARIEALEQDLYCRAQHQLDPSIGSYKCC